MGAAASVATGLLSLGGTAASILGSRRAERDAERAQSRRERQQQALITDMEARNQAAQSNRAALAARQQRLSAGNGLGQRDTLLTGPYGLTAPADTGERKSLLGL